MCASLYIDRLVSRFRFILLTLTLAIVALNPMQDASAQSDLAAMNQQVIRLYQSGQKTEAIALAEKTVAIAKQRLGTDNKVTGILLSQLGNLYRDTGRFCGRGKRAEDGGRDPRTFRFGSEFRTGADTEQPRRRLSQPGHVFRRRETVAALARALRRGCRRASSTTSCAATASTISPFSRSRAPRRMPKPRTARPKARTRPTTR